MRIALSVAATALVLLGCATASHDPTEDATFVCVVNDTEHPLTAEVRDADTHDRLGQLFVSGFGRADRWIRTGSSYHPVMVSVDAVGFVGKWVPPAFRRILIGPGAPLSLTVGTRGVTPFAHSSVSAYCRNGSPTTDSTADSTATDSASTDAVPADSASFSRSG